MATATAAAEAAERRNGECIGEAPSFDIFKPIDGAENCFGQNDQNILFAKIFISILLQFVFGGTQDVRL